MVKNLSPLEKLARAIPGIDYCGISTLFDVENGGIVAFDVVSWSRGKGQINLEIWIVGENLAEKKQSTRMADVVSSFRKLQSDYPTAKPRANSIDLVLHDADKALTSENMEAIVERAWAETFNQPVPSDDEVAQHRKQRLAAQQRTTADFTALLATGKPGIQEYLAYSAVYTRSVDLERAKLAGFQLDRMRFRRAKLASANLTGASLKKAAFGDNGSASYFMKARLIDADLSEASFTNCRATAADFTRANLTRAKGEYGVLIRCKFIDATLDHANFRSTDLRGADFTGASLVGTEFSGARFDAMTRWPDGFIPPGNMRFQGKGADPRLLPTKTEKALPGPTDLAGFVDRLKKVCDESRLDKSLAMLKVDRFRLFARVDAGQVVGVVKSQSAESMVYACRLGSDGSYACCSQNLNTCGGLKGSPCKHLMVLILGLGQANELDWKTAHDWFRLTQAQKPNLDKDAMAEILILFKGAETGEIDWRPTETIPEDFYAI